MKTFGKVPSEPLDNRSSHSISKFICRVCALGQAWEEALGIEGGRDTVFALGSRMITEANTFNEPATVPRNSHT